METSYLKTLELNKIIERAAAGCVCGEAKAKMLALAPQCDPDEVRFALEQTDAINTLLIKNGSPRFGGVEGVSALATRAVKGGVLSMGELLLVAGALRNFQNLSAWYGSTDHDALPTDDLFYALAPQPGLEQQITSAILAPDTMADTASHTLADLRKKIRATENSIRDRLEGLVHNMESSKYLQEAVVSIRNGRYVVPVKSEYRGEISGIIHDVSSTGATVFVEPQAVVEANARILQYRAQEAQEIERILTAFTSQVAAIEPQFQYSYKAMLEIDILLAKARMALEMKAFKPSVSYDGSFSLVRARHPLIDPAKCVPVDIALGKDYDSLIITGPNTGGKTVTLKTAGLLCAMAQCGFLIPADERSEVCVFQEYLVDIGDEQSIEQSLSTFSGHMTKITGILQLAAPGTLVLLDELGAGTDPVEGAALAIAIMEKLSVYGAKVAATTHYAEIKEYALQTPGVRNASCEFDVETLRPTYRLLIGIPGKSNAFAISQRLGLPEEIIEAAKRNISDEKTRFEDVLAQLDQTRQELEKEKEEVDRLRLEQIDSKRNLEQYKQKTYKLMDRELQNAQDKANRIVSSAKAESQKLLDELDELRRQKESEEFSKLVQGAKSSYKSNINRLEDIANPVIGRRSEEEYVPPRPLKKGDLVLVTQLGEEGVLLSDPDSAGNVQVQAGIIKTKVPVSSLRLVDKKRRRQLSRMEKKKNGGVTKTLVDKSQRSASSELDLRGQTIEEAIMMVDQFIDSCTLLGIKTITIIHGKGTGALRSAVQQHLKNHKAVRTFRLGVYGEGEDGVTIAELK